MKQKSFFDLEDCGAEELTPDEKLRRTNMLRYGVPYAMQNRDLFLKQARSMRQTYTSDNTRVDSSYEKIIYEFCKRNNLTFEQQIPVPYTDAGREHVTYIDFLIEGVFVEAKGGHLIQNMIQDTSYLRHKLQIYENYNVVVVTDHTAADEFDQLNFPGVDIHIFDDRRRDLDEIQIWYAMLNCASTLSGFLDEQTILHAVVASQNCDTSRLFHDAAFIEQLSHQHEVYLDNLRQRNQLRRDEIGKRTWVYNPVTNQRTTIPETQLQSYLNNGWIQSANYTTTPGYVWMNQDSIERRIDPSCVREYVGRGWKIGRLSTSTTRGYVLIHKDGEQKFVPPHDLFSYLEDGWARGEIPGNHFSGFTIIREISTGKLKHVSPLEAEDFIDSGEYVKSNALEGRIHIHKGTVSKMITSSELSAYLAEGWAKGRLKAYTANKIWICNDELKKNLRVSADDLDSYLQQGWRKGRIFHKKSSS